MSETIFLQGFDRPQFVDTDPQVVTQEIIDLYERLLDRKLYPAQIERLQSNLQAYRESQVRFAIQDTGEQNLVSFARDINLDYLGELLNVRRLAAAPALCTLRFTLREPPAYSVAIAKGTVASAGRGAGQIHWETSQGAIVRGTTEGGHAALDSAGRPYIDVAAHANTNGTIGNGFEAGEINFLVSDPFPYFLKVENIDQTRQGAAIEDDDRYRRRILLAPEGFAGGSVEAYQYRVLSVSSAIVDVSCHQEQPGHLIVSVLTQEGLPSQDLLAQVARSLKPDRRRPLTDWVTVAPPVPVPVQINLAVTPFVGYDAAGVEHSVRMALARFVDERLPRLGIDIVPSQIVAATGDLPGVYRIEVLSPSYREMEVYQWAHYAKSFGITMNLPEPG